MDLIKPESVVALLIYDVSIALTFGLCSPPLACIILCVVFWKGVIYRFLLGRFVRKRFILTHGVHLTMRGSQQLGVDFNMPENPSLYCPEIHQYPYEDCTLNLLENSLYGYENSVISGLPPLLWGSVLFFSGLCWDMMSDSIGWKESIWIPTLIVFIGINLVVIVTRRMNSCEPREKKDQTPLIDDFPDDNGSPTSRSSELVRRS
jgi:hypothetical protein